MLAAASLLLHASDTRAQERLQLMNVSAPGSDSDGRAGATGRSRRTHGSRMPYPGRRRPSEARLERPVLPPPRTGWGQLGAGPLRSTCSQAAARPLGVLQRP